MKYSKISPNSFGEKNLKKWKIPENKKFGKYVVDDSNFIPMSEQVKELAKMRPMGADVIELSYDYPDGKDRGNPVPFSRTKEGRGMAELSKYVTDTNSKLTKESKNTVKEAIKEVQIQNNIKNLVEN